MSAASNALTAVIGEVSSSQVVRLAAASVPSINIITIVKAKSRRVMVVALEK
jgi:hypothetical protein